MTIDPRTLAAPKRHRPERAVCEGCGHDLTGLPEKGPCPECGRQFGPRVGRAPRQHDQMANAPVGWLKRFRSGAIALVVGAGLLVVLGLGWWVGAPAAVVVIAGVLAAFSWVAGTHLVTQPRPLLRPRTADPLCEWVGLRRGARWSQLAWVAASALGFAGVGGNAMNGVVVGAIVVLAVFGAGGVAAVGVYLARLAEWAGDSALGQSWRSCMMVAPAAVVVGMPLLVTGVSLSGGRLGGLALVLLEVVGAVIVFAPFVWLMVCLVRTALMASWALQARGLADARRERMAKGNARDARECEYCGYDLVGLKYPTRCPECGECEVEERPPRFTDAPKVSEEAIPLVGDE